MGDSDYRSFRDFAPELLKYAMDLSLHTGCGLAAILSLTWKDVHTVGVRRDRWGGKRLSVKEFNVIWGVYMKRWTALPTNQFSFHDIRAKALTDRQLSRRVSRRPGH